MLIELADVSRACFASAASANASLTSRWQSSNVPATATAVTLPPSVVNCASWTGVTPPSGNRTTTRVPARPKKAWATALPVSPEVATSTVSGAVAGIEVRHQAGHDARADVLERERRAVKELEGGQLVVERHERDRKVERRGQQSARVWHEESSSPTKRVRDRGANLGERCAAQRFDRQTARARSGTYSPPSGARPSNSASQTEIARRRLAASADELHRRRSRSGRRRAPTGETHRSASTPAAVANASRIAVPGGLAPAPATRRSAKIDGPEPDRLQPSAPRRRHAACFTA